MSGISSALAMPKWFLTNYYKPGQRIAALTSWQERIDAIVEQAPKWDIGIVCGIPSWVMMVIERIIERYGLQNIHALWPNFNLYIHGGVAFEPYLKSFEQLLGNPVAFAETYMASEGYFGFRQHPADKGISLLLDQGVYFEFVPFDSEHFNENGFPHSNTKALGINEVEENRDYALLVTNCSGAWRYLVGDTIRFVNLPEPQVVITGRTKQFLSVCGEHLSIDNMTKALQSASRMYNTEVCEFTVVVRKAHNRFHHHWFIAADRDWNTRAFAASLDAKLCALNEDYRTAREVMLDSPRVDLLPASQFYEWLRQQGKEGGMFKFPRVMKGESATSWLKFNEQNLVTC
jgi:hypothetical protein